MSGVKKVLSIDMDYLMGPCINLYNDCAGSEEFQHGDFWENVDRIRGIDEHLSFDERKLVFLVELLAKQAKNLGKERFFFGEEHDMILEFLCGDKKKAGEVYDVYNVDHHHDIYYAPNQKEDVDRFDFACLADWVYYLGKNNKINKYYWVKNPNSAEFPEQEIKNLTFPFDEETYCNDYAALLDIEFDYVFICRSNNYFPKKYNYLFDLLLKLVNSFKNHEFVVWNTPYCVDGKTRHVAELKGE